jgi:hypothetical protein
MIVTFYFFIFVIVTVYYSCHLLPIEIFNVATVCYLCRASFILLFHLFLFFVSILSSSLPLPFEFGLFIGFRNSSQEWKDPKKIVFLSAIAKPRYRKCQLIMSEK